MRIEKLLASYGNNLAEPHLLRTSIEVEIGGQRLLAVPLGELRRSGCLDYSTRNGDELFPVFLKLTGSLGDEFWGLRRDETILEDGSVFYSIHWGNWVTPYPETFSDDDAHRRIGRLYGYTEHAIDSFIAGRKATGTVFETYLKPISIEQFDAMPLNDRLRILAAFTREPVELLGAVQGGILKTLQPEAA